MFACQQKRGARLENWSPTRQYGVWGFYWADEQRQSYTVKFLRGDDVD